MPEERKRKSPWRSRKLWGTIAAALLRLFAPKLGVDADAAEGAALLMIGGVGIEGVIDAVGAFARDFKRAPERKTP